MPVDPRSDVEISALDWVPDFARSYVRDYRVRWALEEAAIPYRVRLVETRAERPADYLAEQPFGQVPAYRDKTVSLFESGAIVLHVGRDCETLLPADPAGRARATAWLIAALNTIEPWLMDLAAIDIFEPEAQWAKLRRPAVVESIEKRLDQLVRALGDREYLEGRFSAGDLMMASVLRGLDQTDLLAARPTLAAYKARCLDRPAYRAAIDAQLADFKPN